MKSARPWPDRSRREYPAGHELFAVGDPGDSLYVVTRGKAEIYFKDTTGHRMVLETLGVGEFFGEISLLDAGPRTASVVVTRTWRRSASTATTSTS